MNTSADSRPGDSAPLSFSHGLLALTFPARITSYNVCYTKLLRVGGRAVEREQALIARASKATADTARAAAQEARSRRRDGVFFPVSLMGLNDSTAAGGILGREGGGPGPRRDGGAGSATAERGGPGRGEGLPPPMKKARKENHRLPLSIRRGTVVLWRMNPLPEKSLAF